MGFPVQGLKTKVSQFGSYFRLFCWQIWVCRDDQNTEKEKKKLASLFHFILLTPPLPCPMSLFLYLKECALISLRVPQSRLRVWGSPERIINMEEAFYLFLCLGILKKGLQILRIW
jgi:hypothetical protein